MAGNEAAVISHEYSSDPNLNEFFYQDRRMSFCSKAGIVLGVLATGAIVAGTAVLAAGGSPDLGLSLLGDGVILGASALNEGRHYLQAGSAIDDLNHSPTV